MSREIKFRAWYPGECFQDGKARMFHDVAISAKGKPMHLEGGWDYMGDEEKAIPMQFTGLHDRNGVEVFEGDILSDGRNKAVVMWSEGDLGYYLNDVEEYTHPPGSKDEPAYHIDESQGWIALEVIGNIWENPELLTPSNQQVNSK